MVRRKFVQIAFHEILLILFYDENSNYDYEWNNFTRLKKKKKLISKISISPSIINQENPECFNGV